MYLLDHKTPKRLEEPITTLYTRWVQQCTQRPSSTTKARQAVGCFVYNACYWLVRGVEEFDVPLSNKYFSLPLIYNCNKVNRKVSYTHTRKFLDWLVSEDLVTIEVGSVSSWSSDNGLLIPESTSKSVLKLSSEIIGLLLPIASKEPPTALQDVLEVRDAQGNKITKRLGEEQKGLVAMLNQYNGILLDSKLESDGNRYWIQTKKVFNNSSFDCGGRTYTVGDVRVLDKSIRNKLTIDGQCTAEIDLKASHLSIIAELEGVTLGVGFDPYSITLDGYDRSALRDIAKISMLCLINCGSITQAKRAINYNLRGKLPLQAWKREGRVPKVVSSTDIVGKLIKKNSYASKYIGKSSGLTLQNIEAKILDGAVTHFSRHRVPLLAIHDSVVINERYRGEAVEVLTGAFKGVLGSSRNCKLEIR